MQTRRIGSLEVSAAGLGCNAFGGRIDENRTREVVAAALDAGITFFDTADLYGGTLSEEYLGRALGRRRDDVVIASKFGGRIDEQRTGGGRPEYVAQAAEDSLRRLRTDRIDLYQFHFPDPTTPLEETIGAMVDLAAAGKVREIGCSNFSVDLLRQAHAAASSAGAALASVQNHYSILHREPENGMLDVCEELSVAFLPYFPLAKGLLTGKYRRGEPPPEGTRLAAPQARGEALPEEQLRTVERLAELARTKGHSVLDLAVGFLLTRRAVASVITGATRPEQVRANVAATAWLPDEDVLSAIDEIAPAS